MQVGFTQCPPVKMNYLQHPFVSSDGYPLDGAFVLTARWLPIGQRGCPRLPITEVAKARHYLKPEGARTSAVAVQTRKQPHGRLTGSVAACALNHTTH